MPIFTALGIGAGVASLLGATGAAATFIGGATTALLTTATSLGLSYAARALAGQPDAQQPAANRVAGVQGTLQAAGDVPREFPLGRSLTAGSLVYANFWGNDGDTPNAYFTQVIALSDLPLGSDPTRVFVNGEACDLAYFNPHADFGIPVTQYYKDAKDHLWVKFYDGTQTTADSFVANRVASAERPWGPTRVGAGVAYAIVTALVNGELFGGFPALKFELPGVKLYDISKDSTAGGSGSHRWSDPATWGGDGDDLPAVQNYNILRGITYGGTWLYGLQSLTAARLPSVAWINAVNACRATIDGEDGPEATYRAGGMCRVNTQIGDAIEVRLTACHGRLAEIGGIYKMRAGAPGGSVLSFTDADVMNTQEQTFTPFLGLEKKITGITATYPEPAEAWATKGAPPLYRADLEEKARDRRLLSNVQMDVVPYAAQVQRLMKSALDAAQRARRHSQTMPPVWNLLEPLDVVDWTSDRNGYVSKLFEIDGLLDQPNCDQRVDLTEVDPADYDWDHAVDFRNVPRVPINVIRPAGQGVVDWFAEGTIIYDADGRGRRPAIRLAWDASVVDDIAAVQFEVRGDFGAKDVVHTGREDRVAAGATNISHNLLPATAYEVRGRYIPRNPRDTIWSDWLDVSTPDVRISDVDLLASIRFQIKELQEQNAAQIADLRAKLKAAGNQDARNWLDKREVRNDLSTRVGAAFASISDVRTVAVSTQQAFASYQVTVNAQIGEVTSSVGVIAEAVADLDGWAASRWSVSLDANGHAIGFELFNGGAGTGVATFRVDKFELFLTGVGNKAPFVAGTINGVATFGITGNLLLDGSVKAWNIEAGAVKAYHVEADSISTRELKVNGITLEKLVAGAATQINSTGLVPQALTHGIEATLSSLSIFTPACSVLIAGQASFRSNTTQAILSGVTFTTACEEWTKVRTYVDDILVFEDTFPSTFFQYNAVVYRLPVSITAPILRRVVLTAGPHTIKIKAVSSSFNGIVGGPTFDAGGFAVFESRR